MMTVIRCLTVTVDDQLSPMLGAIQAVHLASGGAFTVPANPVTVVTQGQGARAVIQVLPSSDLLRLMAAAMFLIEAEQGAEPKSEASNESLGPSAPAPGKG